MITLQPPMPDWQDIVKDPFTHPHYGEYKDRCLRAQLDQKFIRDSWVFIIQGLELQAQLKKQGAMNAPNPPLALFGQLVAANVKGLMLPGGMGQQTKMALWSGGLAVSIHVRKLGYETLESTVYGAILDSMTNPTFKIWLGDKTWGPQGKLWNIISAEYVRAVAEVRDTMHVFMRTHDLESVFYREELVNWQKAKGKKPTEEDGLTYHILLGMDSFKTEKVFYSEKLAKQYLLRFLDEIKKEYRDDMLKGRHKNYRLRSAVWADNERAYQDTFKKKTYESYRQYIEAPLIDIVDDFYSESARIENGAEQDFSPRHFANVMDELLSKVKRIG